MTEQTSSQESTNIWDYKPQWCQPWSIILTGLVAIAGSWLILHNIWLTTAVTLIMLAWWVYFLVLFPRAFAAYMLQQRSQAPE